MLIWRGRVRSTTISSVYHIFIFHLSYEPELFSISHDIYMKDVPDALFSTVVTKLAGTFFVNLFYFCCVSFIPYVINTISNVSVCQMIASV